MFVRVLFRVIVSLLLVAALIAAVGAIGWAAYNSGLAQGKLLSGSPSGGIAPVPFYAYGPFWSPFFGWGYGLLGCLVPLLVLFFLFSLIRLIFWGGMHSHRHHGWEDDEGREHWHRGWRGPRRWNEMAEQWHRRQHGGESGNAPGPQAQG
jgi:hypothetical protein